MKHRNWHRLFGITLLDYFSGSNYEVELEKDLSQQKQLLDVVILRRPTGKSLDEWPDGLDNLSIHNLLTYKSHHEPLDSWAVRELVGHYINYRKQESHRLKKKKLLPESKFRLYAVCMHYPQQLFSKVSFVTLQTGVYEVTCCADSTIRIIVTSEVPRTPNNTLWHLFSGMTRTFRYAQTRHRWRDAQTSSVVNELYQYYTTEGVFMPYTMEDYRRDSKRFLMKQVKERLDEVLEELPPEVFLRRLTLEQRLKGVSPQDVLNQLAVKDIEAHLAKVKQQQKRKSH